MVAGKLGAGHGTSNHVAVDCCDHEERSFRVAGRLGDLYELLESVGEIGWPSCTRISSKDGDTVTGLIPNCDPYGRPGQCEAMTWSCDPSRGKLVSCSPLHTVRFGA